MNQNLLPAKRFLERWGLFFLMGIAGSCLALSRMGFCDETAFEHQGVRVTVDIREEETLSLKKEEWGEIVKNLRYFESECLGVPWGRGDSASLYRIRLFGNTQDPNVSVEICAVSGKKHSFKMKDLDFSADGFLKSFRLQNGAERQEYQVLNTQIDEKGDLLERVILLTHPLSAPGTPFLFEEFVRGEWCVYSAYQDHRFTAYQMQTFLVDSYGKRRVTESREGILSGLDTQKTLERKTRFSETLAPFKVVGLRVDEKGRFTDFDLMIPDFFEKESSAKSLHFDVRFVNYRGFAFLEKWIRRYRWKDGRKHFLDGWISENRLNRDRWAEEMKDSWFDILPGGEGLLPEERIPRRARRVFQKPGTTPKKNLPHGTPSEERERIVWVRFTPIAASRSEERKPVLESIRDVRYFYTDASPRKLYRIHVDFLEVIPEENRLVKNREVLLEVLRASPSGNPLEISFQIRSPEGERYEDRLRSDCAYALSQAVEGDLFVLKEKRGHTVCLSKLTPEGRIAEAEVYSLNPREGSALTTHPQKLLSVREGETEDERFTRKEGFGKNALSISEQREGGPP